MGNLRHERRAQAQEVAVSEQNFSRLRREMPWRRITS